MITANTYGLLYNWYAVSDSRKICPEGWRVPDNNDWNELVSFPGGEDGAADKLKETGSAFLGLHPQRDQEYFIFLWS